MPEQQELQPNVFEEEQVYNNPLAEAQRETVETTHSDTEAALRKASLSEDPVQGYLESKEQGHALTYNEILGNAKAIDQASFAQAIEDTTIQTGQPIEPEVVQDILDEDDLFYAQETAPERAWLAQTEGFQDLDEETADRIAVNRYTQRKIAEIFDQMTKTDVAVDIAGLVFGIDETYNSVSFVNKVLGTKTSVSNVLNSADILIKLGQAYQRLTPKEQVIMFNEMQKAAKDVDDNELQQMFLLMAATGFTSLGEERFNQTADKLVVAGTIGKVVTSALRANSFIKSAAELGDIKTAASIADQAAIGKRPVSDTQLSRVDAAASAFPGTTGDLAKVLDGASEEVASQIRDEFAKMDALREESLNFVKDNIRTVLEETPGELEAAVARAEKRLRVENPNLENLVVKDLDDGIEFTFDIIEKPRYKKGEGEATLIKEGSVEHKGKVIKFTEKDITQGFANQDRVTTIEDMTSGVWSPNKMLKGERPLLVQAFERIANAQPKMKSKLTDALRLAKGDLSPKSVGNLERVLLQGDREGVVYSYQDLVKGGIGGVKLTDQEYVAYARTRKVLDDMWWLKNMEVKQKAEARGAKFVTIGEQRGFPSVFDDIAVARGKYQSTDDFKKVYDPLSKATVSTMSNERMQVLYDQGFVLSKLENTGEFWNIDKARFKWAFVRKDEVKDLPMSMLNYKEGYVPRIYDKAYFFVKKADGHVKDGDKVHKIMKADRYFDNASDAEKYKQQLIAEGTKADEVAVVFDREPMNNADLDGDIINIFGGLYASPRKAEPLKFGLEGQEAKLVEPLQAIQQYMHHIGNRLPVAQFRIGMQEKWLNDATDILGKRPVGGFDLAIEEVDKAQTLDPRKRKFLQKAHEQIRTLSNVPTTDEQALQGKFVSVGKSLEERSPKLKGAASFMYSLAQKNPISAAKAATHHMLLGTFSAAQYPIQALGATIAMSINPVYAAKGMPKFFAFTQLDNIKDPVAKAAKIKSLSKTLRSPDLEDAYRLWTRSGYRDSVLVTNGDYATLANGLPYDGNLVRRLFDKGEFFFKSGELVNMRISFATAYERWKDLNKGKSLDDQALKDIFARSEQFRLNMGQGNRARFQKGAISVPLQFQQVHTKFLEAIGPGSAFTPKERAKLMLGQASLFGAMGIPLGQQAVAYFADVMDIDTTEISDEALNTAKRGMTGLMVNNILGFDAEIAGRVSIAGGIADTAWDMLFEDKNLLSIAGPTGAIADRFWNGPIDVLWKGFKGTVSADKLTMSQQGEILQNLGIAFAEIPSGPRNAIIAGMLWESGMVRDSKGRVLWVEDPQLKDVLFRAVGFQSMKVQEYYDLLQSVRKQENTERHMVDSLAKMFMRAAISLDEGDEAKAEAAALTMAVMRSSVSDAAARNRIMKSVSERLKINDKARELVEKAWKKSNDWSTPATQSWSILKQEAVYQDEGE